MKRILLFVLGIILTSMGKIGTVAVQKDRKSKEKLGEIRYAEDSLSKVPQVVLYS